MYGKLKPSKIYKAAKLSYTQGGVEEDDEGRKVAAGETEEEYIYWESGTEWNTKKKVDGKEKKDGPSVVLLFSFFFQEEINRQREKEEEE